MKVLAFVDYYLPGFRGGGPAVSVSRLIENLSGEAEFYVYTRDRDLGDTEPYDAVPNGKWFHKDGVGYFYADPANLSPRALLAAIREVRPDVVYLNSFFSKFTRSALLLRSLGLARGIAFVVAPRGEFSPGALALKSLRKKVFIRAAVATRMYSNVTWQVSSHFEKEHTRAAIDAGAHCFIKAPDVSVRRVEGSEAPKSSGKLRLATLSRISPVKNLLATLEALRNVRGEVRFTVFGPVEDEVYFEECRKAVSTLPANVKVDFAGPVAPDHVSATLACHHFFALPTLGENFGHVIAEALTAGCPVLLSDRTPWRDLSEKGCGWVMPLEQPELWSDALQLCVDMDSDEYLRMRENARKYMISVAETSAAGESGLDMFREAMAQQQGRAA